ncbi:hypothetical protein [Brevundimonas sp. GCM10030266]|uniref:hypothetical protein n=1 Tax=Brevundimonas sp. GCM10030266 TaxID=3273386 RepID=UPI00361571BB
MTATPVNKSPNRGSGVLKGLAGTLGFVCLVLFLMAIEQKQAMDAWAAVRDGTGPAVGRVIDQAKRWTADGIEGLETATARRPAPDAAATGVQVLAGEFRAADDATRDSVGDVAFTGALIRLERAEAFRTRPQRIAAGDEVFSADRQTFAAALDARSDAQIELRQIVPHERSQAVAASALCGGQTPGTVALLHRRNRVEMMIFRDRTIVGPDASADALCGVWRFRKR